MPADALRPLLARLEAASEGSREMDTHILGLLYDELAPWSPSDIEYAASAPERTCGPPHFTTSLDAAVALCKRVLPAETDWDVGEETGVDIHASVWPPRSEIYEATAATPALALCIAIVKAKLAE